MNICIIWGHYLKLDFMIFFFFCVNLPTVLLHDRLYVQIQFKDKHPNIKPVNSLVEFIVLLWPCRLLHVYKLFRDLFCDLFQPDEHVQHPQKSFVCATFRHEYTLHSQLVIILTTFIFRSTVNLESLDFTSQRFVKFDHSHLFNGLVELK